MKSSHKISRRHFIASAGLTLVAYGLTRRSLLAEEKGIVAAARERGASADLKVQELRGGISLITGSGGNIAVLPGAGGKLIVDSGYLGSRDKILAALTSINSDPIAHLINTHWHFDHTDGNEWMHSIGAKIIAHENTRRHLSVPTRVDAWDFSFPPSPAGAIPTDTFTDSKKLQLNGATVGLKYYGPSHTDGDISVYFKEADVLHTGDTWWNGRYPFIDYSTGGHIDGMIKAAETNLGLVTDKTLVIPGHGQVAGKTELTAYRDLLVLIRDRVAELKKKGKSLDEIVAAKPTADYDAKWAGAFINGDAFTRLIYQGLTLSKTLLK